MASVVSTSSLILSFMVGHVGAAPAASDLTIESSVAGLFIGEEKIVEGTVSAAQRDGNIVNLHVGTAPHDLTVSLIIGILSNFPEEPERYYLGKTVRVSGTIQSFRGAPEITVHDPTRIQIVGAASAAGAAAPAAAPPVAVAPAPPVVPNARTEVHEQPPTAAQRIDALSERLRQLEERVEQLERAGSHSGTH